MVSEGSRVALVIGSQCESLGPSAVLRGLEELTTTLHSLLLDPWRGDCAPALPDGGSLLLSPDTQELADAVRASVAVANERRAVLLICFIGHGQVGGEFRLYARDSVEPSLDGPTGPAPYQLIRELAGWLRQAPGIVGLQVIIDACESGGGVAEAAALWASRAEELHRHFEVLASTDDRPAWGMSFSRHLVEVLEAGHIFYDSRLRCTDLREIVLAGLRRLPSTDRASRQPPTLAAHHGGRSANSLWVANNSAYALQSGSLLADSPAFSALQRSFRFFQPTGNVGAVLDALRAHRHVVVQGVPGSGKSTLVAALTRAEVAPEVIPRGLLHGYYVLGAAENSDLVARRLITQLTYTVDGFGDALAAHRAEAEAHAVRSDSVSVLLSTLAATPDPPKPVRIAFDGLDQLAGGSAHSIRRLLHRLATADGAVPLHILAAARSGSPMPDGFHPVHLDPGSEPDITAYLRGRGVPEHWHQAVIDRAAGNWLFAVSLVERVLDPAYRERPGQELPYDLPELFDEEIARSLDGEDWYDDGNPVRVVLTVLTAAGPGAVLPRELFQHATGVLGVTAGHAAGAVRQLAGLIVEEGDGGRLGLFHQSVVDHLQVDQVFCADLREGDQAILAAINVLAPAAAHDGHDRLHQYAEVHEAVHLWRLGRPAAEVITVLEARPTPVHRDNLERWEHWAQLFADRDGPDDPQVLKALLHIARWTGECGNRTAAVDAFAAVLGDCRRVLGPADPLTIRAWHGLARWTGEAGHYQQARAQFAELLAWHRVHCGEDDARTLAVMGDYAAWVGQCGEPERARELNAELLERRRRLFNASDDDPRLFGTRGGLSYWTWQSGRLEEALQLTRAVLTDRMRVNGPEYRDCLSLRHNIAQITGELGDAREALRLSEDLLPDRMRIMGATHPYTLNTKAAVARWTAETGNPDAALELYREVLAEQAAVLIPDHRDILLTEEGIARCLLQLGDATGATTVLRALLARRESMLGTRHPHTRRTVDILEIAQAAEQ